MNCLSFGYTDQRKLACFGTRLTPPQVALHHCSSTLQPPNTECLGSPRKAVIIVLDQRHRCSVFLISRAILHEFPIVAVPNYHTAVLKCVFL